MIKYFDPPTKDSSTVHDVLRGVQTVNITDRMPVILQHEGHSRTIVGYEMTKNGRINLLAFDPSKHVMYNYITTDANSLF
jgi:Peptidase family C78